MSAWWWIGMAIAAGVVEVMTVDLFFLMIAGGCLVAAVAAGATDGNIFVSVLTFALATLALLILARPPLKSYLKSSTPADPMHLHAMVGQEALVTHMVTDRSGRVQLPSGEVWTARVKPYAANAVEGQTVRVVSIDGATAVVATDVVTTADDEDVR